MSTPMRGPSSSLSSPTNGSLGVQASFARVLPDTLTARGLPADGIWRTMGLAPGEAPDEVRVSIAAMSRALREASALTGDPLIALEAAQAVRPAHLGSLGYALMSSPLGGDGLSVYERFQTVLSNELLARHRVSKSLIEVRHEAVREGGLPRDALFWWFLLGARLNFARWVSGRDLVPVRVDIPAPRPAQPKADAFARFIGASVRYDTPDARELMPAEWLSWLNPNADPTMHALMGARTARQLAAHGEHGDNDLLVRTRLALAAGLRLGHEDASLEAVCRGLADDARIGSPAITPRQLQKRLAEHGLSFKALVEEVRRERALHLLRETDQAMLAVAHDCGYAELSPFHRAVRRWTGLTPAQVRLQALDAELSSSGGGA